MELQNFIICKPFSHFPVTVFIAKQKTLDLQTLELWVQHKHWQLTA
jgi:hypothetical protein